MYPLTLFSSGEFGDVYKGTLKTADGDIEVAAKTLKVRSMHKPKKSEYVKSD